MKLIGNEQCYYSFAGRPDLKLRPLDQTVRLGDNVTLYCRASGTPSPTIKWTNEVGVMVQNSSRVVILPTGDLHFVSIRIQDAGYYRCMAENRLGREEASATLILIDLGENIIIKSNEILGCFFVCYAYFANLVCQADLDEILFF